jgi:allantoinase
MLPLPCYSDKAGPPPAVPPPGGGPGRDRMGRVDDLDQAVDRVFRGRVLTPDGILPRRVTVSDGRIVAVESVSDQAPTSTADDSPDEVVLAGDEVLLPGLVDTHVHVNEPGRTEWEGFATATRAAAAGGVTTILDMPLNSIPATTSVPALEAKRAAATGQCSVDVGFWAGAVPDSLGHLAALHEAGVYGFKCFLLDSGVPEFPPLSPAQLRAAMTEIAAFDGLLIVHAEDPQVIAEHARPHTVHYREFLDSRPPAAENTAIATVLDAARATGCRTHIVHLSSAEALPLIVAARADGVRLSVETCPHYLTLAAEDIADGQTQFKCCPPVRGAANADLLWAALADGVIDCVVSDHSPSTPELKLLDAGDFGAAWGGISSLQLGLPLIWTEARRRGHTLEDVVGWMAAAPAAITGLAGKGSVVVGQAADLVVFAPDARQTVDVTALEHRNPVSPYDGRTLDGVVRASYLAGRRVDLTEAPRGAFLTSSRK